MKIDIICVGRIKERFFSDALDEYKKRLSRYGDISVIEVKDEPTSEGASDKEVLRILKAEGERILPKLPAGSYKIVLDIGGRSFSSEALAAGLSDIMTAGNSHICFVIGGSLGLCDEVKKSADLLLSFSKLTFPHQLMRVILLEQIYRAFRIINNEPYHK